MKPGAQWMREWGGSPSDLPMPSGRALAVRNRGAQDVMIFAFVIASIIIAMGLTARMALSPDQD